MCDSDISERCPMDFTNYCPIDSLTFEESLEQWNCQKTQMKVQTGRKTASVRSRKPNDQNLSEDFSFGAYSKFNSPNEISDSREDEPYGVLRKGSLEKASRYVSQEELDALKGCVMRSRAVFSPTPSSSPVHSFVHQQLTFQHSPKHTNSLPHIGKHVVDGASHARQGSLEYDHLKDFDPCVPNPAADSISVQFRLQSDGEFSGVGKSKLKVSSQYPLGVRSCATDGPSVATCGISEGINDAKLSCDNDVRDSLWCKYSPSCSRLLVKETESHTTTGNSNSWPRKELCTTETDATASPYDRCKFGQHQSPFHPSPSPLKRLQEGGTKTYDAGSSYSLYSQITTASSLTDRQHCSYSKGVDGTLFKERTDVSTCEQSS